MFADDTQMYDHCPVHTARLGRVCFLYIFSLGLCFACLFVLFDLFVSPFFCVSLGS